jgi:hypothetical protein
MALAGGAVMGITPQAVAGAQVSHVRPHIVARPHNLMVNTYTTLTGTGLPADSRIIIAECGETSWIAPQNPCDANNTITVTTDPAGGFTSGFKAELCPDGKFGPGTRETCYIGEPKGTGVDTLQLVGAAKIIVTYP